MSSDLGTIFGSGGLVISIISMIYAAINHKRIRAKCCGRSLDFEINIDSTEEGKDGASAGAKKPGTGTGLEHQSIDVPTPTPAPKAQRPATPLSFDTLRRIQMFGKKKAAVAPVAEESVPASASAQIRVKPHRKWAADEEDDDNELR